MLSSLFFFNFYLSTTTTKKDNKLMGTCARCSIGRMMSMFGADNFREVYTPPSEPNGWASHNIYMKAKPTNDMKWYTLPDDAGPWVHMTTVFSVRHSLDEDCEYPEHPDASTTYGYPKPVEPSAFTEHLPPHHIKAWATLTERLANTLLPDDTSKMIRCTPDDFTLAYTGKRGTVWFTNKISGNYLGIKPDGRLRIPTTDKHFYRGYFLSATTTK